MSSPMPLKGRSTSLCDLLVSVSFCTGIAGGMEVPSGRGTTPPAAAEQEGRTCLFESVSLI